MHAQIMKPQTTKRAIVVAVAVGGFWGGIPGSVLPRSSKREFLRTLLWGVWGPKVTAAGGSWEVALPSKPWCPEKAGGGLEKGGGVSKTEVFETPPFLKSVA